MLAIFALAGNRIVSLVSNGEVRGSPKLNPGRISVNGSPPEAIYYGFEMTTNSVREERLNENTPQLTTLTPSRC